MVPSTRHTTEELREGLMRALETRHATRTRTCMIACTLVAGVNDRPEDALKLAAVSIYRTITVLYCFVYSHKYCWHLVSCGLLH